MFYFSLWPKLYLNNKHKIKKWNLSGPYLPQPWGPRQTMHLQLQSSSRYNSIIDPLLHYQHHLAFKEKGFRWYLRNSTWKELHQSKYYYDFCQFSVVSGTTYIVWKLLTKVENHQKDKNKYILFMAKFDHKRLTNTQQRTKEQHLFLLNCARHGQTGGAIES